ncbi:MAG: hypothetical protein DCC68_23440 [Planctomycetota bacterium]|nr:MAG: hypothetical protein DCC68_23440 [Planctomycetota bacterium]
MKLRAPFWNRKASAKRRSSARRRLAAEPLETRLALDADSADAGGSYAVDELPEGAIRFFLSERGIGEGPVVENPAIDMELGETKTLYVWMQLPESARILTVGLNLIAATAGVVVPTAAEIYEAEPKARWMGTTLTSFGWGAPGDILAEMTAVTISPLNYALSETQGADPSYDAASGAYLFGSITVTASRIGQTDLFFENGPKKTVQAGMYGYGLPVHFGAGDDSVLGNDVYARSQVPDGEIRVGLSQSTLILQHDQYEFVAYSGSVHDVSAAEGVLANDAMPADATLELVVAPRFGSVELGADGRFRYTTPQANMVPQSHRTRHELVDGFVYRVVSTDGASTLGSASIRLVAGLAAVDDYLAMDTRTEPIKRLDREIVNNDLWFTQAFWATQLEIVSPPENGQITYHYGEFGEYTPNLGFRGRDRFTYRLTDGVNATTATVFIDVTYENRAPVAAADEIEVRYEEFIEPELLLANDSDPDGDVLSWDSVRIVDGPQHGTLTKFPGSLLYQAASTFSGVDSFSYVVDDGMEESNVVTVTLRVSPPPAQEDDMEETPNEAVGCPNDNFAPGGLGARLQAALCGIQAGGFEPGLVDQVVVGDLVIGGDVDQGWAGNIIGVDVHLQLNGNAAEAITPRVASRVQARRRVAVDVIAADEHFGRSPLAVETRTERRGARRIGRR